MLPVLHRPMIEHVVGQLAGHGVDDVVLSLGYRPDGFRHAYPDGRCAGVRLHYAVEPEPLDTAGAIRFAARDAGIDERFLVLNGDVLTDLDVTRFVAFHDRCGRRGRRSPCTRWPIPRATAWCRPTPHGRVTAFVEKPPPGEAPTDLINAGTYVLEPSVLDRIDGTRRVSVEREVFPAMVADGTLFALDDESYWIDTGTPQEYIQAQLDLLDGLRGGDAAVAGIHPAAEVAPDARVVHSVLGPGTTVAAGARIEGSVLLDGVRVGPGVVVEGSVVGAGTELGAGAELVGCSVVGDCQVIGPGERLDGARRPEACE